MSEQIDALKALIDKASRITVFTGAGISTESGIPDFRGPNGIWKKITPIEFQDFVASEDVRRKSWAGRFKGESKIDGAEPNKGHLAVARLVSTGKTQQIITQNIDGLHQKAGVPDAQVIELHGNAQYAKCLDCGLRHEFEEFRAAFLMEDIVPVCRECGGIVKSATISFGQPMPEEAMERAQNATMDCDMFLVMGSSLQVVPAAYFPQIASQNGAKLVIINNEETGLDDLADLVINEPIGVTLEAAVGLD